MNKANQSKVGRLTIPNIVYYVRDELLEYKHFLAILRKRDVDKADAKLIRALKDAELTVAIRIRDLSLRVLERRINKNKPKDWHKTVNKFCNDLEGWTKKVLPEYPISMEWFLEKFRAEFPW
ncbi:MAG: hypothetical protein V1686_02860 [Patescibacteria group bacterium]